MPSEADQVRQEIKERLLAKLREDLQDWDHIPTVVMYIEKLIEEIEGLD